MSLATILVIIASVMFALVLGGVIFVIVLKFREREEPDDAPFAEVYGSQYTNGHAKFILLDMEIGEKRIKAVLSPRDINYKKLERTGEYSKLDLNPVFFDKRQVESLSDLSSHRQIIAFYPQDTEDLPEGFKKTDMGKAVMEIVQKNNQLSDESNLMKMRLENLERIAGKTFGGKIFTEFSEIVTEVLKDKSDITKKDESKIGKT